MRDHSLSHSRNRPFCCEVCATMEEIFYKWFRFSVDWFCHKLSLANTCMYIFYTLVLQICGKTYKNRTALKVHKKNQHEQSRSANICPHCGKELHSTSSLQVSKSSLYVVEFEKYYIIVCKKRILFDACTHYFIYFENSRYLISIYSLICH